jgi:hypothetical protein
VEHALPLIKLVLDVPQKAKSKPEQVNGVARYGIAAITSKRRASASIAANFHVKKTGRNFMILIREMRSLDTDMRFQRFLER